MSKADRTRQYIIEKTAPVFNSKGFAGTSMADIESATGLTKGSIYGNFANKDEVALAVFEYNLQQIDSIVRAGFSNCTTFKDKLLVYADVYSHFLKRPFPAGGCPILNTAIEADDTHPVLRERAMTALQQWKQTIARLIREGVAAREFRKDVDMEEAAITLIAMIEGGIMIGKLTGRSNYLQAVVRSIKKYINGLA